MDPLKAFEEEVKEDIQKIGQDPDIQALSRVWLREAIPYKYAYNFRWLGRPIIQVPQDIVAIQEIIWQEKPDLVIECGIAHGGSLILSASVLAMLELAEVSISGKLFDPQSPRRKVLGIDIDIRPHNRKEIESHFLSSRIHMIQGSSVDAAVIQQVHEFAKGYDKVMVCLDSNHTHEHVLRELRAYAPLVSPGGYCIVFDTGIEDLPEHFLIDRPWGKGNNPKTAVRDFVKENPDFQIDKNIEYKILITAAADGFLRRKK